MTRMMLQFNRHIAWANLHFRGLQRRDLWPHWATMPTHEPDAHLPGWLRHPLVGAAVLILALAILGRGLLQQPLKTNPGQLTITESAHLEMAGRCLSDRQQDFSLGFSSSLHAMLPRRCDGLVQPLWPWLAAFWHEPMDVAQSLRQSAGLQLGIAIGLLCALGLLAWRRLGLIAALWLMGFYSVTVLQPCCRGYGSALAFQAALWLLWLACIRCLRRNTLWSYLVIGITAALSWLLEDHLVLPILAAFVLASSLRALWGWAYEQLHPSAELSLWRWNHHAMGLALCLGAAAFVCAPRLMEAKQWYGDAWFSLWDQARWLDEPQQAMQWIRQQDDAQTQPGRSALQALSSRMPGRDWAGRVWSDALAEEQSICSGNKAVAWLKSAHWLCCFCC